VDSASLRRFQPNSRVACVEASPPKRSACVRIGSFSIEGSRAGIHLTLLIPSLRRALIPSLLATHALGIGTSGQGQNAPNGFCRPTKVTTSEWAGSCQPATSRRFIRSANRLVPLVTEHHTLFLPPSGSRDRPRSIVDVVNCSAMQLVKPTDCSREPVHQGHGGIRCVPRVWRNVGPSRMHAADSTWPPLRARKSRIIGDVISLTAIALLAGSDAHGSPSTRLSRYQHTKHR
jgi:hypothetical protein